MPYNADDRHLSKTTGLSFNLALRFRWLPLPGWTYVPVQLKPPPRTTGQLWPR